MMQNKCFHLSQNHENLLHTKLNSFFFIFALQFAIKAAVMGFSMEVDFKHFHICLWTPLLTHWKNFFVRNYSQIQQISDNIP